MMRRRTVVYGVTSGGSAYNLLAGQLSWMLDNGWNVVLTTNPDQPAREAAAREGVPLMPVPMSRPIALGKDLMAFAKWLSLLRRLKPNAVNVSTPKAGLLGGLAAFVLRVPKRVYVLRGLRLEGTAGVLRALLWVMERLSTAVATDVVVVSPSLLAAARKHRVVNPSKARVVGAGSSNGVRADEIAKRAAAVEVGAARRHVGIAEDAFVVGFIGRVSKDKGLETLVSAMRDPRLLDAAVLLVVGEVEDESMIAELTSLGPACQVLPHSKQIPEHLALIDILCLPSHREGFPNVVLEAAAAGVPAIVSDATGAVDSVVDGVTGHVVPVRDAGALADRIHTLRVDERLLHEIGENARARVQVEFAPERIWRGILAVLNGDAPPTDV